ncbi:methyl-accepting chemotaxis protein [Rhizobium sp. BK491]|uniref:methyl-accepting chemotaxis protein n=1 Tax=Rhizobium sp. BK491 TaxID=2587009 RepID=UPI00160A197A|nr:methyl-accepting chemotaxis protein [Rhizobium sp. BK491]MBB3572043.1 methyl-accepting chemotaxis protein [Rhizobium sp. BK491]
MKISIKTGLTSLLVVLALAFCGNAFVSLVGLNETNVSTISLGRGMLPSVRTIGDLEAALTDKRLAYAQHILSLTPEAIAKAEQRINDVKQTAAQQIAAYRALAASDIERKLIDQIDAGVATYDTLAAPMIELSRQNKNEEAAAILNGGMRDQALRNGALLKQLKDVNLDAANQVVDGAAKAFSSAMEISIATIVVILGLSGFGIYYAVRVVSLPLTRITGSMKDLAQGALDREIPYRSRADEIGNIAAALEVFRESALANQRLEREVAAQRALSEQERDRVAQLEGVRAEAMAYATAQLGKGLQQLSRGDLTGQITEPFVAELESLRVDFNSATTQLAETLRAVADATSAIDVGTSEISQGAQDLSKRTEQQAASLEETAAALDEITVNVSNSSKRADEARAVAAHANAGAAHSGVVVSNAVNAMQRIEQSSNQIANIIGVIDEIAFQTNLLALNAGVEAARAGEAGKGFAVVAQEVRELAQRSAQAAKEIKDLIRSSSVEVQSGVKLVSETGEALKTIEGYIITVNQHMDAIATSAKEQSVGLSEVNIAVNQMDQVTQQNAAMVEQTTAASATLADEATRLRELISQFQLGGSRTSPEAPRRKPAALAVAAIALHKPTISPARKMANTVAVAFGAKTSVSASSWEEF